MQNQFLFFHNISILELSALGESESAGSGKNLDNARIKKIREDYNKLRDRFSKQNIRNQKEPLQNRTQKNTKIKEIEQNLIKLEESLFNLSKYHDDLEYILHNG